MFSAFVFFMPLYMHVTVLQSVQCVSSDCSGVFSTTLWSGVIIHIAGWGVNGETLS